MPCHQYRYNPAWRQLRSWLDEGAIGRWHLAEFEVWRPHADHGAQAVGTTPWRGLRAHSRGGVLLDHGTHLLYLVLDVAGPPLAVHAWTGRLRHRDYDVEDTAHLLLEYQSRAVTLFLTWAGTRRENRIRFVGEGGTAEWVGGLLRLETAGRREELDFTAALDKAAYKDWFAALFTRFAGAMDARGGAEQLEEITQVASILEQAYAGTLAAR
jgi:predicted dehydrogenase